MHSQSGYQWHTTLPIRLDTTYDRTISNYDWDGEYAPSKQNWPLSRTSSDHLWPLACVLPVITFGIYNLQIPLPCTTNRSTWYQIHKNGRKAPFLKVSTHSLQLREKFKPFFTVYNFNSITATEYLLHQLQLLLKKCEPVLHTLNRGFVMKHAWSLTMYTQQFWNLLLLMACWKRFH